MDEMDRKILAHLCANARMTVKDIAKKVSLTSPAVSERIRRLEKTGVIAGYTARLNPELAGKTIQALVSISVTPAERAEFQNLLQRQQAVELCYQVTGTHSHMVKVSCADIDELEKLLSKLQKLGQTNTQIILAATPGGGGIV